MLQAASGAAELARRLLTLGRQQISKPRPTSIAGLLGRLQTSIRRILPDDVQLVMTSPAEDATALVDEVELERAMLNLVLNAGDAMPSGGTLTIAWRCEDVTNGPDGLASGRYVSLSVSDTGEGMDRETLDRIFDPFFTTKGDKGGTGLGLATVYAFAKESRGAIDASSTPGAGTTFTLLLPECAAVEAGAGLDHTTRPAGRRSRVASESSSSRIGRTFARACRASCRITASMSATPVTATVPCACCPARLSR